MQRLYFLLLFSSFIPLAQGDCPPLLEGLTNITLESFKGFDEAVETACGRRNYTTMFWSRLFCEHLFVHTAHKPKDIPSEYENFQPFFRSMNERLYSIDNAQARRYVQIMSAHQRKFMSDGFPPKIENLVMHMFGLSFIYITHPLSVETQFALAQTIKRGFGVVETTEMKRARIDTAMMALERTASDNKRLDEFYGQLYLLAKEKSVEPFFLMKEKNAFEEFAYWVETDWNSTGIAPLEVLPAVETLYEQYRTLRNSEAKTFVDWILSTLAITSGKHTEPEDVPEILRRMTEILIQDENGLWKPCPSYHVKKCYFDLPTEAKNSIESAFPELSDFLKQNGFVGRPKKPTHQLERQETIDRSGLEEEIRSLRANFAGELAIRAALE